MANIGQELIAKYKFTTTLILTLLCQLLSILNIPAHKMPIGYSNKKNAIDRDSYHGVVRIE